jgi:uncharacterized protein (TIGR00297 family)
MDYYLSIVKIAICVALSLLANRYKILDVKGTMTAFLMGIAIAFSTNIKWLFLMFLFAFVGFLITKFKFKEKEKKGSTHRNGTRRFRNVLANGLPPTVIALFSLYFSPEKMAVPFIASIAIASSDTFASEIGILSDKAYLITNFKRVEVGTNGAVSWLGQGCALLGSFIISIIGVILLKVGLVWLPFCALIGFVGCQIDSLLGATFQGKGKMGISLPSNAILNNDEVNAVSISSGAFAAFIFAVLLPF